MDLEYKCPGCGMEAQELHSADHILEKPKLDDLWLCGNCVCVCKVTLEGLIALDVSELDKLDADTKSDLHFAMRAIRRNIRNQ